MASSTPLVGNNGRRYLLKQAIQDGPRRGRVWLGTSGNDEFILKDIPTPVFSRFNEVIYPRLRQSPFLWLPQDTIRNRQIFVYERMKDDLRSLVGKQIPIKARKQILKATLRGIADMHSHHIAHLDIKPDNIMVNYRDTGIKTIVEQVQIANAENAAYLRNRKFMKGRLTGEHSWRSPEAHLMGKLSAPSDMFSFAVVCIYAMLGRAIFGVDQDMRKLQAYGVLQHVIRLQRQVSYFGDQEGWNGLNTHISDNKTSRQILWKAWADRAADYHSYRPFPYWPNVTDDEFKDLIGRMTNLDPLKRATAQEMLEHPWFADCEIGGGEAS